MNEADRPAGEPPSRRSSGRRGSPGGRARPGSRLPQLCAATRARAASDRIRRESPGRARQDPSGGRPGGDRAVRPRSRQRAPPVPCRPRRGELGRVHRPVRGSSASASRKGDDGRAEAVGGAGRVCVPARRGSVLGRGGGREARDSEARHPDGRRPEVPGDRRQKLRQPVPPAATLGHIVRPGQTLWSIAREHGVPVEALIRANGLTPKSKLRVGQRLSIPLTEVQEGSQEPPSLADIVLERPPATPAVSFIRPVPGPIVSPYGPRGVAWHGGIDLRAERHDPIHAAAAGHGDHERMGARLRARGQDLARERSHDRLRAQPREPGEGRRLGRAGPGDRDRRQHGPRDRASPPLRDPPERPEVQSRLLAARGRKPRGSGPGPEESQPRRHDRRARAVVAGGRGSRAPAAAGLAARSGRRRPRRTIRTSTDDGSVLEFPADEELDEEEAESLGPAARPSRCTSARSARSRSSRASRRSSSRSRSPRGASRRRSGWWSRTSAWWSCSPAATRTAGCRWATSSPRAISG